MSIKVFNAHLIFWLLAAVLSRAMTQLMMKFIAEESLTCKVTLPLTFFVVVFCILLLIRMMSWQRVLTQLPLSTAYPFFGLTVISIMGLGHYVFGEAINVQMILGAIAILVGISLIGLGTREHDKHA